MDEKIRVLIVDDAAFMRKTIRKILESDKRFTIIGTAKNGQEAVKMNLELKPDAVTLDVDMPVMDGVTALRHMMIQRPVPIVIVSSLSYETDVTFEAFRLGVIDFVPKPTGAISKELEKQKAHLCNVVSKAAGVDISRVQRVLLYKQETEKEHHKKIPSHKVVVIGSSLGGPNALVRIISKLPAQLDFSIVAIMQMSSKVMDSFVHKLDKICHAKIIKAKSAGVLNQGYVYIHSIDQAPPTIKLKGTNCTLEWEHKDAIAKPIDHIMLSAITVTDINTGGVLLTGTEDDGIKGFTEIHNKSGKTIVQRIDNAIYPEKPSMAIRNKLYNQVLDDSEIAEKIVTMMSSS